MAKSEIKPGFLTKIYELFKAAAVHSAEDDTAAMGAALAYYSILSLGPLLLLMLAGAAVIFGTDVARGRIVEEFNGLLGTQGAQTVRDILSHATPHHKVGTTVLGIGTLLFGASGVFGQLQTSLNRIWRVQVKEGAIAALAWERLLSFTMVLGSGFLLLISLVLSALLSAFNDYIKALMPSFVFIAHLLDVSLSLGVTVLLFTLIFKYVPDIRIGWRSALIGGSLTAIFFIVGKILIGLYIGHAGVASGYGAAGSAVILLLWVYYSSQILLFGAEFTRAYAIRYQPDHKPSRHALWAEEKRNKT